MKYGTIVALFRTEEYVENLINKLNDIGFDEDKISIILKNSNPDLFKDEQSIELNWVNNTKFSEEVVLQDAVVSSIATTTIFTDKYKEESLNEYIVGGPIIESCEIEDEDLLDEEGLIAELLLLTGIPEEDILNYIDIINEGGIFISIEVEFSNIDVFVDIIVQNNPFLVEVFDEN